MNNQNKYIPGVCNIGSQEVNKRKRTGWIGLVITIILWLIFIWSNTPHLWRVTIFVPATISAMGFIQAYMHFCAYFGWVSLFNFGNIGKTDTVSQAESRAKDRRKAWKIIIFSFFIGFGISLAAYYVR